MKASELTFSSFWCRWLSSSVRIPRHSPPKSPTAYPLYPPSSLASLLTPPSTVVPRATSLPIPHESARPPPHYSPRVFSFCPQYELYSQSPCHPLKPLSRLQYDPVRRHSQSHV